MTLSGPVLAEEVGRIVATVWSTPGVVMVENRLAVHERPNNVPGLQGRPPVREEEFELRQEDLVRFKSLIERGKTSAHGEEVRREQLGSGIDTCRAESAA